MDIKYHWLRCRESQGQFCHYWALGKTNNGDHVTKHHAPIHHQATRPIFLTPIKILQELRGRVTNWPWEFILEERFSIGHGLTPFAYIPTYVCTHNENGFTPLVYVPTYKRMLHYTCIRTYVQTYFPLHSTSQSGVEQRKSMNSYKKPDAEKIARRWKNCQMLKKNQIYSP